MATFTSHEDVLNAYQSEPVLWDTVLNATEEKFVGVVQAQIRHQAVVCTQCISFF